MGLGGVPQSGTERTHGLSDHTTAVPVAAVAGHILAEIGWLCRLTPPGCFVEVGVYQGGSAWYLEQIAREQGRALFLYDTFCGIPYQDAIDAHRVGDFSDTSYEAVSALLPRAHVIRGVFPGSAVEMPPVAFAHLDCDQYRSVKEAAMYLRPRMVRGGIMWFDDSPCLEGARQATAEVFNSRLWLSCSGKHFVVCE